MTTYRSLLDQAEEFKRTGQHDRALGVLTYIHAQNPTSEAGISAAMLLSGIYKDLGCMERSYVFMRDAMTFLESTGHFGTAGGMCASLACGALYTRGVTLEAYTELTQKVVAYQEAAYPKVSHLAHDFSPARKLRVGILSPDLCMHSLAYLVAQPLLRFTKVTPHELYLYHLRSNMDGMTRQLANAATKFLHVHSMSDEQIVKQIVEDKIDVLIDISGYTAETRLSVFYRQPAPVQMGWISGMMTPTGLQTIPYFLTDKYMKPEQVPEPLGTPIVAKSALTYHTLREKELDVTPLPADATGYISFASFNNPCKINSEVLAAWSRILRAVPKSRLHLKTNSPLDTARIQEALTAAGIDASRLILMPPLPSSTDVQIYYTKHADIFLDAWPCSGCLTTVEAMWVGVPVVSYYTDVFCSRQSHSILNNAGISDLSHPTIDGYVEAATKLAFDRPRLRDLRKDLRGMLSKSPLCDYTGMASELGQAVLSAWQQTISVRANTLDLLRKAA